MAMASISASCVSSSSAISSIQTRYIVASSHRQVGATAKCFSCGTLRDGFTGQGGSDSADDGRLRQWSRSRIGGENPRKSKHVWRVMAGLKETELTERQWGPPIRLGTAQLPPDVDLNKLQSLLFQWGNGLTQNANLPLPVPLKVDKVEGGVRLGYIKVTNGKVEDLVHIDVLVTPPSEGQPKAKFLAIRNGQLKNSVPPGEPMIMQSLLAALKKSLSLARTSS